MEGGGGDNHPRASPRGWSPTRGASAQNRKGTRTSAPRQCRRDPPPQPHHEVLDLPNAANRRKIAYSVSTGCGEQLIHVITDEWARLLSRFGTTRVTASF